MTTFEQHEVTFDILGADGSDLFIRARPLPGTIAFRMDQLDPGWICEAATSEGLIVATIASPPQRRAAAVAPTWSDALWQAFAILTGTGRDLMDMLAANEAFRVPLGETGAQTWTSPADGTVSKFDWPDLADTAPAPLPPALMTTRAAARPYLAPPPTAPPAGGASPKSPAAPAPPAADVPACEVCGGDMWDNRADKRHPRSPDFRCKDKACDHAAWLTRKPKRAQPK